MKKIITLLLVSVGMMSVSFALALYQVATTGHLSDWLGHFFLISMTLTIGFGLVVFYKMFVRSLEEIDEPKIKISFDNVYRYKNPVSKFHRDEK